MLTGNNYCLNFPADNQEEIIQLIFDPSTEEDVTAVNVDHDGNINQIYITLINPHNKNLPHYFKVEYSDKTIMNFEETLTEDEIRHWLQSFCLKYHLIPIN